MARKLTTEEFIKRAKQVHGNKYDYSKSIYVNGRTKITISCKIHGAYEQYPLAHTTGKGCKKCGWVEAHLKTTWTTKEFFEKANEVHKGFYSYENTLYKKSHEKVSITCPIHGEFTQIAYVHIQGSKCPKCSKRHTLTKQEFLLKAKEIHKNKYDYSQINFYKNKDKVKIECKLHGFFTQQSDLHLKGHGCPHCAVENNSSVKRKSINVFLEEAKLVHGDIYDYSKVEYQNTNRKVKIVCNLHGSFLQTPKMHLRGRGCPKCKNKNEGRIAIYLKNKFITYRQFRIENKYYDFFLPKYNLILERDGEQHYRTNSFQTFYNISGKEYLKRQVKNDKLKTKLAKKEGYKIARIPYWLSKKEEEIEIDNILAGKPTYPDVPDLIHEKTKPIPKKNLK